MKLFAFTILKDGIKTKMATNSPLVYYYILYKDKNKLGLRKRTAMWQKLDQSKIVLNEKDVRKIYDF